MNKLKSLKLLLALGALYYLVGAVVHLFGFTLFPFYDGALYQPYHDAIIAVSGIVIGLLLFVIANNPIKNIDSLNVVIIGGIIAFIFMGGFLWKIDFIQLGAPAKREQTIVEMVMLLFFIISLIYLYPKDKL